jgi:PAS domain S-box-containing protein
MSLNQHLGQSKQPRTVARSQEHDLFHRQLLDSVPGMIYQFCWAADGSVSFPYVSAGCRSLLELEPETVQHDADVLIQMIHPDDRADFKQSIAHSAQTLALWKWEGRFQTAVTKTIRWIEAASQPELQPNGAIIWSGMLMDITRRKQAEDLINILNRDLEQRIEIRTHELHQVIEALKDQSCFFEISQDLLCITGFDGYFKQLNPQWTNMLGYSLADLQAQPFIEFIHPEDRIATLAEVEKLTQGKTLLEFENRWLCQDGSIRWLQWQAVALVDKQLMYASARDISDRKRVEAEMQTSESKNRALLTVIPDMMFRYNRDGVHLDFFPSSDWDTLVSPDVFLGKSLFEVLPEDVASALLKVIQTVLETKTVQRLEYQLTIADELHDYEARVVSVTEDEVLAIVRDISDRKQAEAALRSHADRQSLLNYLTNQIRNSLDHDTIINTVLQAVYKRLNLDFCGLVWFFPDSDPPMWEVAKAVQPSDSPYRLEGQFPSTLVGPIEEPLMTQGIVLIHDVDQYDEPIHRAFLQQTGAKSVFEVRLLLQNGQLGILAGSRHYVQPWAAHEVELLQAVATQMAIALNQAALYTESQNRAQELADTLQELQCTQMQMIQSEKMSSLGQLVAGVAHEINNPVNFIYGNLTHANEYINDLLGLVDLYQQHYPTPAAAIVDEIDAIDLEFLKTDLVKLLNSMKVGAERIQAIVASLRTFSRMDEAEKKQVNIHDGIDSTLMILQNRTKARHDRPEIEILKAYGNLPVVDCYAGQLNQVFMNILVNAIDALEEAFTNNPAASWQPQITIRTKYLHQAEPGSSSNLITPAIRITIEDNGIGMPESVKARIFDPFYTTKPIGKGTGMGMSISYQIITQKHGGTLTCNSTPNLGTQFVIQIPADQ